MGYVMVPLAVPWALPRVCTPYGTTYGQCHDALGSPF